jgi:hypothetical protein
MRKQYYFRASERGLLSWDVDRLVDLTRSLPPKRVPLSAIRELDETWLGEGEPATWRSMIDHIRLVDEADLAYPIILSADGRVMDGMHRVVKAAHLGHDSILAVQFDHDPPPDHVGLGPEELPY